MVVLAAHLERFCVLPYVGILGQWILFELTKFAFWMVTISKSWYGPKFKTKKNKKKINLLPGQIIHIEDLPGKNECFNHPTALGIGPA